MSTKNNNLLTYRTASIDAVNKFTFVRVADLFRHVCFHYLVLHLFVINAVFGGNIEAFVTWLRDGDWTALLDHLLFATHGLIGCTLQNQEKKFNSC